MESPRGSVARHVGPGAALGVKFAGAVIGYSIDMGSPRKPIRREDDDYGCPKCE